MRRALLLTASLVTTLFAGNIFATAIVYQGFECQNAVNANDITPSETLTQSKFEVIEDVGDGMYHLRLTGGLPRFIDDNSNVCIDSETAIGFFGIPETDGLPARLDAINATAYFNGHDLIITVNSINTDLSSGRNNFSIFTTSFVFPFSNTLILTYNPPTASFTLKKVVHNRGLIHTRGATNSITPFLETVLPSFIDTENDRPRILTPASNIEYLLE